MEVNLYGEIGFDVTLRDLDSLKDGDTIRINSYGGDVFEAQAIYNRIKNRGIKCVIDGICASAATLIACGCESVAMPKNAVYMVHQPGTYLNGLVTATDLTKALKSLQAVETTLIAVYQGRINKSEREIQKMLIAETWLNARDAKELGFIDEVLDADSEITNKIESIFNRGEQHMDEQTMYEKFKAWFSRENAKEDERNRISQLEKVQTTSVAQQAIINLAKTDGRTLTQIQAELDAIAIAEKDDRSKRDDKLFDMLKDYFESNAGNVGASPVEDKKTNQINEVVKYANEVRK